MNGGVNVDGLFPALQRLDRLLEAAVARARAVFGAEAGSDRFRGLYVDDADLERLFAREAGAPLLFPGRPDETASSVSTRLAWLGDAFDLSPFDADVLLLALAPELDLRYERLYAYLQDDVTRKRPTVDLALSLLCRDREERLGGFERFLPESPLLHHRLIELLAEPTAVRPPLLAHYIKLDDQIVHFLLGLAALDRRLASCARLLWPADDGGGAADTLPHAAALGALAQRSRVTGQALRLYLRGPPGSGRRRTARQVAAATGSALLELDLTRLPADDDAAAALLAVAAREAQLQDAVLYVADVDALLAAAAGAAQTRARAALESFGGVLLLAGTEPWIAGTAGLLGVVPVSLGAPPANLRAVAWRDTLAEIGAAADDATLATLAARFRLTPRQIADAVAVASTNARWAAIAEGAPGEAVPTPADLFAAARGQSGHDLAALASRIEPVHVWRDLVLPDESLAQLQEIGQRVVHHDRVLGDWGFGARLSRGRGVNALFTGPSGTGKTMAAEVVAGELGLHLYRVELAGVVSKYIGETEKNLDRIFRAAERTDGIVFFDEADALFGKRSEVHDSHDRYANIEISYLLQRMEEYEGIAILATNLRGNLDQAFIRRLAFTVHFPFPDEVSRRRIWVQVWPADTPLAEDLDFDYLATQFSLSGGNIKNIALGAAFLAAESGGPVTMAHLLRATRREYQKVGKTLTDDELGAYGGGAS